MSGATIDKTKLAEEIAGRANEILQASQSFTLMARQGCTVDDFSPILNRYLPDVPDETRDDYAEIGETLCETLRKNMPDYNWNESPAEVVMYLLDRAAEPLDETPLRKVAAKLLCIYDKGRTIGGSEVDEWNRLWDALRKELDTQPVVQEKE